MEDDLHNSPTTSQIGDYNYLMHRLRKYYRRLLLTDGKFSHAAMARCFFLLRSSIEITPDDSKYCDNYVVNIRQLFTVVRKLMTSYTSISKKFPYCNDLHELLVAYVELEVLVYCKSSFDLHNQGDVENNIIQTLRYMLFDPTAVSVEENIKNEDDACILRCLYTLKMVSLTIRFSYPLIENMASKLSGQLEQVTLYEENEATNYETETQSSRTPTYANVLSFFKKCHEIATARLYYFNDNDAAEAEELQPVYNGRSSVPKKSKFNFAKRPVKMKVGIITDQDVLSTMEYHRDRYFSDYAFQYVDVNEDRTCNSPIIVIDDDSDNDSENETNYKRHKKNVARYSPISIDSDVEDMSSYVVETSYDKNSFSSNSVINSSMQSQIDALYLDSSADVSNFSMSYTKRLKNTDVSWRPNS